LLLYNNWSLLSKGFHQTAERAGTAGPFALTESKPVRAAAPFWEKAFAAVFSLAESIRPR
jgi:hypothetical protein